MDDRCLILIELNEINFDIVRMYLEKPPNSLINFKRLMNLHFIETLAEENYKELEPWIQWPSVHTGKYFREHQIFRLGDIVNAEVPQIFEKVESLGFNVGAISPMNATNKLLSSAYFIPDPWTNTLSDGSFWSRVLSVAISQAVNDNARSYLSVKSKFILSLGFLKFARTKNYGTYLLLALNSYRKTWRKALFLDLFLNDVHLNLFNKKKPNFSTVFFNAGAHIQHHYLLSSSVLSSKLPTQNPEWYLEKGEDPIIEMLKIYDKILGDYFSIKKAEFLLVTGLSQKPYERVKFYYRLRNHEEFLTMLGIKFARVLPRMTRDFLIEFDSKEDAKLACQKLSSIKESINSSPIFGEIEDRGMSIFVTLTYHLEISAITEAHAEDGEIFLLYPHVVFVALKNGMHQSKGYAFFSKDLKRLAPENNSHIGRLFDVVLGYFSNPKNY